MTIQELHDKKRDLDEALSQLIQKFNKESDCYVQDVIIDHDTYGPRVTTTIIL